MKICFALWKSFRLFFERMAGLVYICMCTFNNEQHDGGRHGSPSAHAWITQMRNENWQSLNWWWLNHLTLNDEPYTNIYVLYIHITHTHTVRSGRAQCCRAKLDLPQGFIFVIVCRCTCAHWPPVYLSVIILSMAQFTATISNELRGFAEREHGGRTGWRNRVTKHIKWKMAFMCIEAVYCLLWGLRNGLKCCTSRIVFWLGL